MSIATLSADACWQTVADRDAAGHFVYAVLTTGVYCRPGCASRRPRRENVRFFATPAEAERAGFRACTRCRPNGSPPHAEAVARACELLAAEPPPALEELAAAVGLSPAHFHRLFKAATGVTPKAYASALRAERMRAAVATSPSVTAAIYRAGFQSSGRFYANATRLLGMPAKAIRAGGKGITIHFAVGQTSLGALLVASTELGLCAIALGDDPEALVHDLEDRFPRAELIGGDAAFARTVTQVAAFVERPALGLDLPLHVQGTAYQHRVWEQLCQIPPGETRTYAQLAAQLGHPGSARAVARAVAGNALAVAIPCHRVVRTDGVHTGYRWGIARKASLLAAEQAQP